jgi:predicted negative regulator of RcsB-dependent stress response
VANQRLSRKELLKQPDQFISWTATALTWGKQHLKHILYGVVGLVVALGLIVGWTNWQKHRTQRAMALLYEAVQLLKTPETTTPDTETPNVANEATVQKGVTQLQAVSRDYGGTPAGALAHWHLGHYHFGQGDYTAALAAYEQARQTLSGQREPLTAALVTLDVAYAQEASGACPQAIASYEAVQHTAIPWLQGEALFGLGRCYEQSGAKEKAIAVYERALAEPHVTGELRQTISDLLAQLQPAAAPSADTSGEKAKVPAQDKDTTPPNKP